MRTTAARLVGHDRPLEVAGVELGEPGPGEVVVELSHAGVNPVDRNVALGKVAPDAPLPRTMGLEGVGTVGGRRVLVHGPGIGTERDGVWAGAVVVPEDALVDVTGGVDSAAAATMGVAGSTAWRTVTELARVTAGDRVLVLAASGGVGSIAVSVAAGSGATVWGQTADAGNDRWIVEQGAERTVVVGEASELAEAVSGLAPTVVIDSLGDGYTGAAVQALSPHGRLVLFGTSAAPDGLLPLQALYGKGLSVLGYGGLIEPADRQAHGKVGALAALAEGRLRVRVDSTIALSRVNDALGRLGEGGVKGKLVLDLSR